MSGWHDVAADDLPQGDWKSVVADGKTLLLCHTPEGWFAADDRCTHAESRLSEGRLRGCRIICSLHGAAFDLRDGRVLGPPATQALVTYPVRIRDHRVEICLPG